MAARSLARRAPRLRDPSSEVLRDRHTFISDALTKGLNVKFIAEYTGTSLAMIEQHYRRFLEAEASAQLRLLDAARGRKRHPSTQG
jgi:DNA-binding NarL/FixJ family response regulator